MTKREIDKRIYLSGVFGDYIVHHDLPGDPIVCDVSRVKVGNVIVKALRELAYAEHSVKSVTT